jgi:hypothetical protein
MNDSIQPAPKRRRTRFLSAKYFLTRGLELAALFLIAHLAGLRDYTAFLSGTTGELGTTVERTGVFGTIYIVLYLGCVVVAPILLLAAGLLTLWDKARHGRSGTIP